MYYNGKKGKHVATFLNEVHIKMYARYNAKNSSDAKDAKILQDFFQELKMISQKDNKQNPIHGEIINQLLYEIEKIQKTKRNSKMSINTLFRKTGTVQKQGEAFEKDIADVIEAVYNMYGISSNREEIWIGSKTGNVDKVIEQEISKDTLESLGNNTVKYLSQADPEVDKYYFKNVFGEIDDRGLQYTLDVNLSINPWLDKILQLLNFATFSAKSYRSMTWDQKIQELVKATGRDVLHLGKSNPYRAITGTLSTVIDDKKTIDSAFFAGMEKIKDNDSNVSNHFFHLRYIYELTGAGILYDGESFGDVKYLIYNDPDGSIYVKSTKEIIADILDNDPAFTGNPLKEITVNKNVFE